MALITDPAFYAVAVPAVLMVGLSKSGFGGGFGALGVPLMALTVSVPQAAAVMLPLLCIMDVLGVRALWRQADRALLRLLLPAGLLGLGVGMALFKLLAPTVVAALVGGLTLVFLAVRLAGPAGVGSAVLPAWVGRVMGMLSGFTSFVAHAGSPPIGFYMMPLKLAPVHFTATMAVFFACINFAKWPLYGSLGLIDLTNMATALVLAPLAPLGVWVGVRLVRRVSPALFYRLFELGMLATGCKLLWDGWR